MPVHRMIILYLPTFLLELIPWIVVGLLLLMVIMLFFFLAIHRRNNMRRFAEMEEKMLFYYVGSEKGDHLSSNVQLLAAELKQLKEEIETLKKMMPASTAVDANTLEKLEVFKKGIHQYLIELHDRIKQNEMNTNRMLHYLEDLRENLEEADG